MRPYDYLMMQKKDLVRKELIPKHTLGFFTEPNIRKAVLDWQKDPIKERHCMVCGITIRAPGMWMTQHMKIHSIKARYQEKAKESDHVKTKALVYYQ